MDGMVEIVLGSASGRLVDECARLVGGTGVEVRKGSVIECGWDCDAALVNAPLAHERYGGVPEIGRAQVLLNDTGDGAPGWVITTVPLALREAADVRDDQDRERFVRGVMDSGLRAMFDVMGEKREPRFRVLVHLEAAAFDRLPLARVVSAVLETRQCG